MSESKSAHDKFHEHLDVCEQCRKHPFQLCRTGELLLKTAAMSPTDEKAKPEPPK